MWYQIFLWCLAASVLIHCVAACFAFGALRRHSRGRFLPLLFLLLGFLYPVTGGVITSEWIRTICVQLDINLLLTEIAPRHKTHGPLVDWNHRAWAIHSHFNVPISTYSSLVGRTWRFWILFIYFLIFLQVLQSELFTEQQTSKCLCMLHFFGELVSHS